MLFPTGDLSRNVKSGSLQLHFFMHIVRLRPLAKFDYSRPLRLCPGWGQGREGQAIRQRLVLESLELGSRSPHPGTELKSLRYGWSSGTMSTCYEEPRTQPSGTIRSGRRANTVNATARRKANGLLRPVWGSSDLRNTRGRDRDGCPWPSNDDTVLTTP
jgi:hypothetical protein